MHERGNWVDSAEMPMLYDGPYPTSFYHRVFDAMHAEFRASKVTRGRGLVRTSFDLLGRGQFKKALSLQRDAIAGPVHRARLERERRRWRVSTAMLPIELSRQQAGRPSAQDEA